MSSPSPRPQGPLALALGNAVRAARLRAALSRPEAARRIGMPGDAYGDLERGKHFPSLMELRRVCEVLGVSSDVLLGLDDLRRPGRGGRARDSLALRRLRDTLRELDDTRLRALGELVQALLAEGTPPPAERVTAARGRGSRSRPRPTPTPTRGGRSTAAPKGLLLQGTAATAVLPLLLQLPYAVVELRDVLPGEPGPARSRSSR